MRPRLSGYEQDARGNGHRDGAGGRYHGLLAGERALDRSKELGFRPQQRSGDVLRDTRRGRRSQHRQEPEGHGGSDALGDQGVKEPGHHGARYAWLDPAVRAGGRALADRDHHRVGSQVADALERLAQVRLDDDRVGLARRHGDDQVLLGPCDGDDVEPARPEPGLHAADTAGGDHAEPVALRRRPGRRT